MMSGNPNWWSMMNGMHLQISPSHTSDYSPSNPFHLQPEQDFPIRSWSQFLLQGDVGGGEEERFNGTLFQQQKKFQNWEDQVLNLTNGDDVNQVIAQSTTNYGHHELSIHADRDSNIWVANPSHHHLMHVSSPISTSTTNLTSNNILSFIDGASSTIEVGERKRNHDQLQDHSSEVGIGIGIGIEIGGVSKKARVQQFSPQPVLKVRKEKIMDRVTALHQLVSPFGKTDTASVLSAATGCIRILHAQIEALSSPYMRNASGNSTTEHHQHSVHGRNCLFQEEPDQGSQELGVVNDKDLRSRGLCLVPISCTQHFGNDNGADYWACAAGPGGGF